MSYIVDAVNLRFTTSYRTLVELNGPIFKKLEENRIKTGAGLKTGTCFLQKFI